MSQAKIDLILNYDPNADEDLAVWGSYVPTRQTGPAFKLHPRRHQAVSAARLSDGAVYSWCNGTGRWELEEVWLKQKEVFR